MQQHIPVELPEQSRHVRMTGLRGSKCGEIPNLYYNSCMLSMIVRNTHMHVAFKRLVKHCEGNVVATGGGKQGCLEIAGWLDEMNEPGWQQLLAARQGCDVISLAHFLPYQVTTSASFVSHQ